MLFRSRRLETPAESRFGVAADAFVFRREGDLHVAEVASSPESAVDLFHGLSIQLPPVVDFAMHCLRSKRRLVGEGLQLTEVREAFSRLRVPLARSGGVELAVYTPEEQLALSPNMNLWIYARSDRWLYLLLGSGLEETHTLPRRTWSVAASEFTGAAALVDEVTAVAGRLTLKVA